MSGPKILGLTLADVINSPVLQWLLRELVEALEKCVETSISLRLAELKDAASVDPLQIRLRVFINPDAGG